MTRRVALIGSAAAAIALLPTVLADAPPPPPGPSAPSVRIHQEVVRLHVTVPAQVLVIDGAGELPMNAGVSTPVAAGALRKQIKAGRRSVSYAALSKGRPAEGVLSRTARRFIGDGRYRPQPFPVPAR